MKARTLLIPALAGFLVMAFLAWIWHGPLMGDYYDSLLGPATREEPITEAVAAGYALLSVLMVWMYAKQERAGDPWADGVRFGALIGVLWSVPLQFVLFGTTSRPFAPIVIDAAWHLVEQGAGGLTIALIHHRIGGAPVPDAAEVEVASR